MANALNYKRDNLGRTVEVFELHERPKATHAYA